MRPEHTIPLTKPAHAFPELCIQKRERQTEKLWLTEAVSLGGVREGGGEGLAQILIICAYASLIL